MRRQPAASCTCAAASSIERFESRTVPGAKDPTGTFASASSSPVDAIATCTCHHSANSVSAPMRAWFHITLSPCHPIYHPITTTTLSLFANSVPQGEKSRGSKVGREGGREGGREVGIAGARESNGRSDWRREAAGWRTSPSRSAKAAVLHAQALAGTCRQASHVTRQAEPGPHTSKAGWHAGSQRAARVRASENEGENYRERERERESESDGGKGGRRRKGRETEAREGDGGRAPGAERAGGLPQRRQASLSRQGRPCRPR